MNFGNGMNDAREQTSMDSNISDIEMTPSNSTNNTNNANDSMRSVLSVLAHNFPFDSNLDSDMPLEPNYEAYEAYEKTTPRDKLNNSIKGDREISILLHSTSQNEQNEKEEGDSAIKDWFTEVFDEISQNDPLILSMEFNDTYLDSTLRSPSFESNFNDASQKFNTARNATVKVNTIVEDLTESSHDATLQIPLVPMGSFTPSYNYPRLLSLSEYDIEASMKALLETFQLFINPSTVVEYSRVDIENVATILNSHGFIYTTAQENQLHHKYGNTISFHELKDFIFDVEMQRIDLDTIPQCINIDEFESLMQIGPHTLKEEDFRTIVHLVNTEQHAEEGKLFHVEKFINESLDRLPTILKHGHDSIVALGHMKKVKNQDKNVHKILRNILLKSASVEGLNLYNWNMVKRMIRPNLSRLVTIDNATDTPTQHYGVFVVIESSFLETKQFWKLLNSLLDAYCTHADIIDIDSNGRLQIVFSPSFHTMNLDLSKDRNLDSLKDMGINRSETEEISEYVNIAIQFVQCLIHQLEVDHYTDFRFGLSHGTFFLISFPHKMWKSLISFSKITVCSHDLDLATKAIATGNNILQRSYKVIIQESLYPFLEKHGTLSQISFSYSILKMDADKLVNMPSKTQKLPHILDTTKDEINANLNLIPPYILNSRDHPSIFNIEHCIVMIVSLSSNLAECPINCELLPFSKKSDFHPELVEVIQNCIHYIERLAYSAASVVTSVQYTDNSFLVTICYGILQYTEQAIDADVDINSCISDAFRILSFTSTLDVDSSISISRGSCQIGLQEQKEKRSLFTVNGEPVKIAKFLLMKLKEESNFNYNILCDASIRNTVYSIQFASVFNYDVTWRKQPIEAFTPLHICNDIKTINTFSIHDNSSLTSSAHAEALQRLKECCTQYLTASRTEGALEILANPNQDCSYLLSRLKSYLNNFNDNVGVLAERQESSLQNYILKSYSPLVFVGNTSIEITPSIPYSCWRSIFPALFGKFINDRASILQMLPPHDRKYASMLNPLLGTSFQESEESIQCVGRFKQRKLIDMFALLITKLVSTLITERVIFIFKELQYADELSLQLIQAIQSKVLIIGSVQYDYRTIDFHCNYNVIQSLLEQDELKKKVQAWASNFFQVGVSSLSERVLSFYCKLENHDTHYLREVTRFLWDARNFELKGDAVDFHLDFTESSSVKSLLQSIPLNLKDIYKIFFEKLSDRSIHLLQLVSICGFEVYIDELLVSTSLTKQQCRLLVMELSTFQSPGQIQWLQLKYDKYKFKYTIMREIARESLNNESYKTTHFKLANYFTEQYETLKQQRSANPSNLSPSYLYNFERMVSHKVECLNHPPQSTVNDMQLSLKLALQLSELLSDLCLFSSAAHILQLCIKALGLHEKKELLTQEKKNEERWLSNLKCSVLFAYAIVLSYLSSLQKMDVSNILHHLFKAYFYGNPKHPMYIDIIWNIWWYSYYFEPANSVILEYETSLKDILQQFDHYSNHINDLELKNTYKTLLHYIYAKSNFKLDQISEAMIHAEKAIQFYNLTSNAVCSLTQAYGQVDVNLSLLFDIQKYMRRSFDFQRAKEIAEELQSHVELLYDIPTRLYYYTESAIYYSVEKVDTQIICKLLSDAKIFIDCHNANKELEAESRLISFLTHFNDYCEYCTKFNLEAMDAILSTMHPNESKLTQHGKYYQYCKILLLRAWSSYNDICDLEERVITIDKMHALLRDLINISNPYLIIDIYCEALYLQAKLMSISEYSEFVKSQTGWIVQSSNLEVLLLRIIYSTSMFRHPKIRMQTLILLLDLWEKKYSCYDQALSFIQDFLREINLVSKLKYLPEEIGKNISQLEVHKQKLISSKGSSKVIRAMEKNAMLTDAYLKTIHDSVIGNTRFQKNMLVFLQDMRQLNVEKTALKLGEVVPNLGVLQNIRREIFHWDSLLQTNQSIIVTFVPSLNNPWSQWNYNRLKKFYKTALALGCQIIFVTVDPAVNVLTDSSMHIIHDDNLRLSTLFRLVLPSKLVEIYNVCMNMLENESSSSNRTKKSEMKELRKLQHTTLSATYIIDTRTEKVVTIYLDGDFRNQIPTVDIQNSLWAQYHTYLQRILQDRIPTN